MTGEQVKEMRTDLGLTQVEFGQRMGVRSTTAISHWEKWDRPPGPEMTDRLEQLYVTYKLNGAGWANIKAQPHTPFAEVMGVPEALVAALANKPTKVKPGPKPKTVVISAEEVRAAQHVTVMPIEPTIQAQSIEQKVIQKAMNAQGLVVVHEEGGALLMFVPTMMRLFRGMGDTTEVIISDLGTSIIELEERPEDVIAQIMATMKS